jgi:gluconate kinase
MFCPQTSNAAGMQAEASFLSHHQSHCSTGKRRAERDSETLAALLAGIRQCILRIREDCHILFVSVGGDYASRRLQDSAAHFMRCCLHMYNMMEEGLNYLEDPSCSTRDVQMTVLEAEQLSAMVHAAPSSFMFNGLIMVQETVDMLTSTLEEMLGQMVSPGSDSAFVERQRINWGCVRDRCSRGVRKLS